MLRANPSASFRLTAEHVAAHGAQQVLCLAADGVGRKWPLYKTRPGASHVTALHRADYGIPDALPLTPAIAVESPSPAVLRVDIRGPIEETAGYHDPCGGWTDGNDAISERLCAAFAEGDVLLCIHSPGGNPAGAPEAMRRALEAKAAHGRRCVMHTEGMVASLGFWWGAVIADEHYASADARLGSIGARGATFSEAGALAQAGIAPTFSAWPGGGKLCNVPELATTELTVARNDRDVAIIGEAFANAVASSPLGKRTGLDLAAIVALDADVLTGQAAKDAGLCDDLATLEDVAAMMLDESAKKTSGAGTSSATGDRMSTRAEGGDPPKDDKAPESTRTGAKPDGICKSCGMGNTNNAKFCNQCGTTMAAEPMEEPDDKEPESTRAPKAGAANARAQAPRTASALTSVPALRSALARSEGLLDSIAATVGAKSHAEIGGALEALTADATNGRRYRTERNTERAASEARERIDILRSLADAGIHARGEVLVDIIDDKSGKATGVKPAKLWGDGPEGRTMANLRGYARTKLDGTNASERSPYDRTPHEASEAGAKTQATGAQGPAAKKNPAVRAAVKAGVNEDEASALHAREFGRTA